LTGAGEVLAGLLLLFPMAAALGAVVVFPCDHVMVVNGCCQIGVQDLSTVLVLIKFVLAESP
jgi:hypothetical protein